jgi:DNA-binding MarR family transcriptional regulator
MMVLWDKKELNVKELGEQLYLDSGTLTPLLKKLEAKGYISRERSKEDERTLNVTITEEGDNLRKIALDIPEKVRKCVHLKKEESEELYQLLYKILSDMEMEGIEE